MQSLCERAAVFRKMISRVYGKYLIQLKNLYQSSIINKNNFYISENCTHHNYRSVGEDCSLFRARKTTLESFKQFDQCSICHVLFENPKDENDDGENGFVMMHCGHIYHLRCLTAVRKNETRVNRERGTNTLVLLSGEEVIIDEEEIPTKCPYCRDVSFVDEWIVRNT